MPNFKMYNEKSTVTEIIFTCAYTKIKTETLWLLVWTSKYLCNKKKTKSNSIYKKK